MIGKLTGKIEIIGSDSVIIDVSGVGYLVYVSSKTISKLENAIVTTLLIETYVREDLIHLYGFLSAQEKECFLKLNLVSGVGTKVALAILSSLSSDEVASAIAMKNKEAFRSISGIGPKLAERILLELKDKNFSTSVGSFDILQSDVISDSVSALINLGINKNDAYQIVQKIVRESPGSDINDVIRLALKNRNG